jgi:cell division septum initiation protein DivIVA
MNENQPVTAQPHREDSFDITVRGYNRQQVLEYMARSNQLRANLEQSLAAAKTEAERAREEAAHALAEAERLRSAQVGAKPKHETVSARLSQILQLATEEAEQERSAATEEITKLRTETQAETERMLTEARAEAERQLTEARQIAERELTEARETAAQELAAARELAEQEVRAAQDEADRLELISTQRSEELIDEAQRRAGAVNDVTDQRLETLTATHGEAVLRLGQIRDVLADLLDRDAAAGSLSQVVEAVIAPRGPRPAIDTQAELEDGNDPDQTSVYEIEPTAVHAVPTELIRPDATVEDETDETGEATDETGEAEAVEQTGEAEVAEPTGDVAEQAGEAEAVEQTGEVEAASQPESDENSEDTASEDEASEDTAAKNKQTTGEIDLRDPTPANSTN